MMVSTSTNIDPGMPDKDSQCRDEVKKTEQTTTVPLSLVTRPGEEPPHHQDGQAGGEECTAGEEGGHKVFMHGAKTC